jgi:flagellar hook-length control protein FliK
LNPLSIFTAASRSSGLKDQDSYSARDTGAPPEDPAQASFARMLDPSARTEAATPPRTDAPRRDPVRDRGNRQERDEQDAPQDDSATRRADAKRETARKDSTSDEARGTAATDESQPSGTDREDAATEDTDAGWPPPGLGGFGMMLLAQPETPAPTAALPAAATGALALLQGDAAAGAAPTAAPTATPPSAGAIALPGLAPTTATAADGAAGLAALAAQALAAQAQGTDAADSGDAPPADGIDGPGFMLPTLPQAPTRLHESSAIFSASPTPTPDLQGEGFDDAVSTRLAWLADQKIGHAHIKISPDDMGPIEVQLKLDGDKVQANFTSAHADVRQALEQSIPRLREMLGQHGFQLSHADVGAQQQNTRGDGSGASTRANAGTDLLASEDTAVIVPASVLRARGLLDAYA